MTRVNPLAFSTLGTPGTPLAEVASIAVRYGFSGVELRAADGEAVHVGLTAAQRRQAAATAHDAGVRVLALASYVHVADPAADEDTVISDGIAHGRLAADLGAGFLRVFPGGRAGGDRDALDAAATRRLRALAQELDGTGVTVALETHDSHPRGADVARIVREVPGVAVIWDVLHPWRAGETPDVTWRAVADRIAYVQIKDVGSREDLTPVAPGDGALPLDEVAALLRDKGFRGFVSWEYERAWFPDCAPLPMLAPRVIANWTAAAAGPP